MARLRPRAIDRGPQARAFRSAICALAAAWLIAPTARVVAVNITPAASAAGKTPEIVGYNSGHFLPGSNTTDWWRYSGVNGARVWPTPTVVEASDDLGPWGDGVASEATFVARRTALRANPLSTSYINWPYIEGRYQNNPTGGSNTINLKYAFGELRGLGIDPLVAINYTNDSFPWGAAGTTAGWGDRWEQWQHFYIQAFYLARNFDVHRFQMYNEPNGDGNLPAAEWLERLRFSSDAVQAAVADVNRIYGKSLDPQMQGPVSSGNPLTRFPEWGQPVLESLHTTPLGTNDPSFQVIDTYAYQRYDQTAATFGSELAQIKANVAQYAGGAPMRVAITEFNVNSAGVFDGTTETLDSPAKFARFGGILAQLANNRPDELYVFKLSQGPGATATTVKKNGTHFVDNDSLPYNIGGVTAGGEVVRLFAKGFAGANDLYSVAASGTGSTDLRLSGSRDADANRYFLFSANEATASRTLTVDLANWGIAPRARAVIEEVSADRHGEVSQIVTVPQSGILNLTQPAQSVFLISVSKNAPAYVRSLAATADAVVKSGTLSNTNFGAGTQLFAQNDAADPSARNVSFIKFNTGSIPTTEIENAILQVDGLNVGSAAQVITHVYALTADGWNESTINWNNAPNLKDSLGTAVDDISENFIDGIGSTARFVGHLTGVASSRELAIDVTSFVRDHPDKELTFLVAREVRIDGENVDNSLTALRLASRESGTGPRLLLALSANALTGDYNRDGVVDAADYDVWRRNVASANTAADGNGNGIVDIGDYVLWRNNQGSSLPGAAAALSAAMSVPEPSTVLLGVWGFPLVLWLMTTR